MKQCKEMRRVRFTEEVLLSLYPAWKRPFIKIRLRVDRLARIVKSRLV
jgi:hypothetical protein